MATVSRAEKVFRNDEAIRGALIDSIAEHGWDSTTISGVARRAGVTVGAVYLRAENIVELANDVWTNSLGSIVRRFFEEVGSAARSGDPELIKDVSLPRNFSSPGLSVGLELVVASLFDDELSEVIGHDFARLVRENVCESDASLQARHHQAAKFLVTAFMLGRVLARSGGANVEPLSDEDATTLAGFYSAEPELHAPLALPKLQFVRSPHDVDLSVEEAAIATLSKWGYRRATFSRIARRANTSPGALIAGYSSKADFLSHAARVLLHSPLEVWQQYEGYITSLGSAEIRTEFLVRYLDPANSEFWKLNLELARIASTDLGFSQFKTPADPLQRTHLAVMFLAFFVPDSHLQLFQGCFRVGVTT